VPPNLAMGAPVPPDDAAPQGGETPGIPPDQNGQADIGRSQPHGPQPNRTGAEPSAPSAWPHPAAAPHDTTMGPTAPPGNRRVAARQNGQADIGRSQPHGPQPSPVGVESSVPFRRPRAGGGRGLVVVLSGNMLLDAVEVALAVVALPRVAGELHLSRFEAQWVMGGFALGFGAMLPFAARVAGAWGRRRVYLVALLVFAVASVAGGFAPDGPLLIATRVVKGVCAALTAPTGLAIIAATFPPGPARGRALSVYSLFGAGGFSIGLVASGLLTGAGWRWAFLAPAPVALALFAFGPRYVPAGPKAPVAGPRRALLARPTLLRSALGAAALNGSYWGLLYVLTFRAQADGGWSPLRTGLALLPASVPLAVSSATGLSRRLAARAGNPRPIAAGAAAATAGCAVCLRAGGGYAAGVLPALLLVGLGFVLAFAALHAQAVAGVPGSDQPAASGLYQSAVQLGGAAVLAAVAVLDRGHALALVTAVAGLGLATALSRVLPGRRTHAIGEP
jgi:MFS family permease